MTRATATPPIPAYTTAGPLRTIRPDPDVWTAALALADGDPRRLLISDGGRTVHVLNSPR